RFPSGMTNQKGLNGKGPHGGGPFCFVLSLYFTKAPITRVTSKLRLFCASYAKRGLTAFSDLRDRESVAVGVLEPGNAGSAGCGPDAGGALVHALDAEHGDTACGEPGDGGFDVGDLPAEDGEDLCGEVADTHDAQMDRGCRAAHFKV